ncbi:T9SS type B sorting domain-containing protein [Flavobacterium adhaerens]|uniref:T9SS type B sorting domain-containing protein n=1 Tax=Flavobacterium adhaerens TaxID=3149043 RepID=UPI0032B564EF
MTTTKSIILLFFLSISSIVSAQYITIEDNKTAQELVENVLVNSSCATTENTFASGDNYTQGQRSYGYFNAGTSNFPFKDGVILSTASSQNAVGPYVSDQSGGGNYLWGGDPDLDKALGITSTNATVLEFDFVPLTNFISFNYIFASNEYQYYFPCEYSDGFAFLIKEAGSTEDYKNLAVLPGTSIPVSSQNVHLLTNSYTDYYGITHSGCPAINESYFNGFNTPASPINFSAQTIKLNAQSDVVAGKKYHIKLVIADDKEQYFDSAIFLEAGSFSSKMDLGPDRTTATNNPLCFGESYTIDTNLSSTYTYEWYKDGSTTPLPGETNSSLTVTNAGTYKVKVILYPSTCRAEDEIKIEYAPQIVLNNATLYQCDDDGDGITLFDLTKIDNIIKNNNSNLTVIYHTSLANAQGKINPISTPNAFTNTSATQTLYARVSNEFGCVNYATVNLAVSNNVVAVQSPIESCDTDALQDGITQFDLTTKVTPQILNGLPSGLIVEYYATMNDAIVQQNVLPNLFTNTTPNQQTIYARIVNNSDCYKIIPETLIINVFDPANFEKENAFLCNGSSATLTVDSGYTSYLWNNGDTDNTTTITAPGDHSVIVTNSNGCEKTKEFNVISSENATITDVKVNSFAGNDNTITISYTGNGDYEFSLDGNTYQDSPVFRGLEAGTYWATARDKNGCNTSTSYKVFVLDYPRFFTPNNDGFNDTWEIQNLDTLSVSMIAIFDRYGKLLKQLNPAGNGWNGTFNGKELPADDYWFSIQIENDKIIKGHFSLIR